MINGVCLACYQNKGKYSKQKNTEYNIRDEYKFCEDCRQNDQSNFISEQMRLLYKNYMKYPYVIPLEKNIDIKYNGINYNICDKSQLACYPNILEFINKKINKYITDKMLLNRIVNSSDIKNLIISFMYNSNRLF